MIYKMFKALKIFDKIKVNFKELFEKQFKTLSKI